MSEFFISKCFLFNDNSLQLALTDVLSGTIAVKFRSWLVVVLLRYVCVSIPKSFALAPRAAAIFAGALFRVQRSQLHAAFREPARLHQAGAHAQACDFAPVIGNPARLRLSHSVDVVTSRPLKLCLHSGHLARLIAQRSLQDRPREYEAAPSDSQSYPYRRNCFQNSGQLWRKRRQTNTSA